MAERYSGYIVNGGGSKPGFRPLFEEQLGCANIHDLKKDDFINIAVAWDASNFGIFINDPDIKTKASQAQKDWLYKQVAAARKKNQDLAAGAKRAKSGKKSTTDSGKAQKAKKATSQRTKTKAKVQEEQAISTDDEDQDGAMRMAGDEDAAEAPPMVEPTADALFSPHGGKRKRRTDTTPAANKRVRIARSKSLIVKFKLANLPGGIETWTKHVQSTHQDRETDDDENTAVPDENVQGPSKRQMKLQTGTNSGKTNSRRALKGLPARLQQRPASQLEPKPRMNGNKNALNDATAATEPSGDAPGASATESVPSKPPSRIRLPWDVPKDKTELPDEDEVTGVDDASNESDDLTDREIESEALSPEETVEDDEDEAPTDHDDFNDELRPIEERIKRWFGAEEYKGSPYDEIEAHKRVCVASGNMGSTRDPDYNLEFKGTHKVDGFMRIPPLWKAKKYRRNQLDVFQRMVYDAQKEEWERQDALIAGLPPPKKPAKPKKKKAEPFRVVGMRMGF